MSLELKHEFSFWVSLKPPIDFGAGPTGQRIYLEVTDGEATGERFNARAVGASRRLDTCGSDGFGRIDVRLHFATDDSAHVYIQYFGLLEINEVVGQALATGAATNYEDQYFRTTPRMETGDSRYAWMNQSVFVCQGTTAGRRGRGIRGLPGPVDGSLRAVRARVRDQAMSCRRRTCDRLGNRCRACSPSGPEVSTAARNVNTGARCLRAKSNAAVRSALRASRGLHASPREAGAIRRRSNACRSHRRAASPHSIWCRASIRSLPTAVISCAIGRRTTVTETLGAEETACLHPAVECDQLRVISGASTRPSARLPAAGT